MYSKAAYALAAILVLASAACVGAEPKDTTRQITLAEAVDIALKSNPALQSRNAETAAAVARVGMANAMTKLQLSTTTFATKASMPMIIGGPDAVNPRNIILAPNDDRIGQNFMLMYPLYTGGQLSGQVRRAKAAHVAVASDALSAHLDIALETKIAFYKSLLARMYVDAYQKRTDEAIERKRIAEEAFKEGRIAKYDLLRNQTELAEAQQMLIDAQKDTEIALADLKSIMGQSQTSDIAPVGELICQEFGQPYEKLEALAIAQRPEIVAAKANVRSAESSMTVSKSAYRPQVYATAMQEFAGTQHEGSDQGYLVGITAAIPILDGGNRKSAVDESRAMLDQQKAGQRETELMVARDVAVQIAELNAETKKVGLSKSAVDQAEEDYKVIRLRYESGKSINVEVLDALASLTRARTNYAEALYRHNVARERLIRAIGQK